MVDATFEKKMIFFHTYKEEHYILAFKAHLFSLANHDKYKKCQNHLWKGETSYLWDPLEWGFVKNQRASLIKHDFVF